MSTPERGRVRSTAPDVRSRRSLADTTSSINGLRTRNSSPRRSTSTNALRSTGRSRPGSPRGTGRPGSRPSGSLNNSSSTTSLISKDEIKKKFKEVDRDGSGSLDLQEIKQLFAKGKSTITDKEIEVLFHMVDKNHNGKVDFNEFVDYIYAAEEHKGPGNPELEVEIPMGGGGLILGGKAGNAVVKVGFIERVKVGWRAVAVNGQRLEPMAIARFLNDQGKKGKFCMSFEVDEMTALSIKSTRFMNANKGPRLLRDQARQELQELLGCTDLTELGQQSEEQRKAQLSDARLARLLVDAHAVFEAEVLLGGSSGEEEARHMSLLKALEADDAPAVRDFLKSDPPIDLRRRDEDGNMPIHVARSVACAMPILTTSRETRNLLNTDGRNPLNEQVSRRLDGVPRDYMQLILGPHEEEARRMLLQPDHEYISAAMRMSDADLRSVMGLIPPWDRVAAALRLEMTEVIPALRELAGDEWPGLLAFHCFRDVLRAATHTERSWARLGAVWNCMARMLSGCINREDGALEAAKAMLKTTKGPCLPPVDMRLPYRRALEDLMSELHRKSAEVLQSIYDMLTGDAAKWLKWDLKDELSEDLLPDEFTSVGLFPRLRMDYKVGSGSTASPEVTPAWAVSTENPTLDVVYNDLRRVGMLGDVRMKDSAYDMLRLGGMGEVAPLSQDSGSMWITRCYGAYLRGVCQCQQTSLRAAVQGSMGEDVVLGETLLMRAEAKQFPRIMEKTLQRIEEINHELKDAGIHLGDRAHIMLRTSAAFICDINGITMVAETPEELRALYGKLVATFRLLRTKNTYLASTSTDYRDVKLFLGVNTDVGELVVEAQLILAEGFREKRWMHLPYTFIRGDLDWPYIRTGPSADSGFREGWCLYHGIKGTMCKRDFEEAERVLVTAARQGHFVARGLCHREGWGGYRRDEDKALSCFKAAAKAEHSQAGRREGKCRLAMFHLGAITNVAASRERGLLLLLEAAKEGEPEAVYQLAIHEFRYEEQRNLIKEAANFGHQRAKERLSGYMTATRKVLNGEL